MKLVIFGLMPHDGVSFLLFPVKRPELFDAVVADEDGCARMIPRYAPAVIAPVPASAVRSVNGTVGV